MPLNSIEKHCLRNAVLIKKILSAGLDAMEMSSKTSVTKNYFSLK